MTEKKALNVTLYARIGDSEVLNELATVVREFDVEPITAETRQSGDAPEATTRVHDAQLTSLIDRVTNIVSGATKRYMVVETVCTHCNGERAVPLVVAETDRFDDAIDDAESALLSGVERFVINADARVVVWSKP